MKECVSHIYTSRKLVIHLGGRSCVIFSLSLLFLWKLQIHWGMPQRKSLVLETRSLLHFFVLAYTEIYLFTGNPFQAHSLEQSCHPPQPLKHQNIIQNEIYKCKYDIQFFYLTFMHCACKFLKHKQNLLSENYEQTFPNKSINNLSQWKYKQIFPNKNH